MTKQVQTFNRMPCAEHLSLSLYKPVQTSKGSEGHADEDRQAGFPNTNALPIVCDRFGDIFLSSNSQINKI